MKNKGSDAEHSKTDQIPQNLLQTVLFCFWPPNNWRRRIVLVILIIFVGSFAIWISLPESKKTEAIDYLRGSNKVQSSPIVTQGKEPSLKVQKNIQQHTEGDQSPAIVSNGDVNINIGGKDGKRKNKN